MNYCVCPYRPWQIIVIEKCAHYRLDESKPWMLKLVLILIRFFGVFFPMVYELCIFFRYSWNFYSSLLYSLLYIRFAK